MKWMNVIAVLLIAAGMFHCSERISDPELSESREMTVSEKRLVESGNTFGLKLFREMNKDEIGENMFISPLSISYALGMTLNGAAGDTREAMIHTLEFQGMPIEQINESYKGLMEVLTTLDPDVIFTIANSIWYRMGFHVEQEFKEVNKKYFDALVESLDFTDPASVDVINDWISEKTNGLIEDAIESIDDLVMMLLINAIYFKGTWVYEFDPADTKPEPFYLADGSQTEVEMMNQRSEFHYYENDQFQAIDLPYGSEKFSMSIFLPKPDVDINNLIDQIDGQTWNNWVHSFPEENQEVNLYLPKFTMNYEKSLVDVLKSLGMGIAFDQNTADFTNINRQGRLFIDDVRHITYIEVDEEGTEAAAVTIVVIQVDSIPPGPPPMRIDRPFFFVIRENHNDTILFMGKVMNPNAG
jgi:serine protease inhibitor